MKNPDPSEQEADRETMKDLYREDQQGSDRESHLFAENCQAVHSDQRTPNPTSESTRSCCRWCEEEFKNRAEHHRHRCPEQAKWDRIWSFEPDSESVLRPQTHEIGAKLLFTSQDKRFLPFLELSRALDGHFEWTGYNPETGTVIAEDNSVGKFNAAGETWEFNQNESKITTWQSNIKPRDIDDCNRYFEYNVGVVSTDDVGQKRVNFQFRPALSDAHHIESNEPIRPIPSTLPEGIRVQVDSVNVNQDEILDILQSVAAVLDVRPEYFGRERLHEWSRVYNYALYVRVRRSVSERRLAGSEGLLERLAVFSSRRRGEGQYEWDNPTITAHYNTVGLNQTALQNLLPDQRVGKVLKLYHLKQPPANATADPTSHPKLEVQFSTEYSDDTAIPWQSSDYDVTDLKEELDEYLICQLNWAGLATTAEADWVVPDAYWEPEDTESNITVYPDPLEKVKETEEGLAVHHLLNQDTSRGERAVLRALAETGKSHYRTLAAESETSTSTVYRAVDRFSNIIKKTNGVFEFADDVLREKFQELFEHLDDALEWVEKGIEHIQDSERLIGENTAFASWARRYGASVLEREDSIEIEFQAGKYSKNELQKILRRGYKAARRMGSQTAHKLMRATIRYRDLDGNELQRQCFIPQGTSISVLGDTKLTLG
jgi:hypothetical protein